MVFLSDTRTANSVTGKLDVNKLHTNNYYIESKDLILYTSLNVFTDITT